jgi:hypothetical protein
MRRSSLVIRFLLGLTALATVWCLGCSAFDPLLAALFPGAGATMVCASEGSGSSTLTRPVTDGGSGVIAAASHEGAAATSCGCESCHAPVPTQLAAVVPALPLPHQPLGEPGVPPSIDRTPLVPPPQRVA